MVTVLMPYIGGVLSINAYKVYDRKGKPTNKTRPIVVNWMSVLTKKIKEHPEFESIHHKDITVKLTGYFKDLRRPDLHNLHKIIADAIELAIEVNDKYVKFIDGDSLTIRNESPIIRIEIFSNQQEVVQSA